MGLYSGCTERMMGEAQGKTEMRFGRTIFARGEAPLKISFSDMTNTNKISLSGVHIG